MARTNRMFSDTEWGDLPRYPRHESPEAKYFLVIKNEMSELAMMSYIKLDERELYAQLILMMSRQITEHMLQKHADELRNGITGMVVQHYEFDRASHSVQMGVYVMTPQELDELKAAWREEWEREYQGRQKAYPGGTGPRQAYSADPQSGSPVDRSGLHGRWEADPETGPGVDQTGSPRLESGGPVARRG